MLRHLLTAMAIIFLLAACRPDDQGPSTPDQATASGEPAAVSPSPQPPVRRATATTPATAANTRTVPPPQPSATPRPGPTATSLPGTLSAIQEPLLVDGVNRRIFARAQVNAVPKTVVLSTEDGRLRAVYDDVGQLAYQSDQLIIDQPQRLLAYDTKDHRLQFEVPLPGANNQVAPQIDQLSGRIFAFRDHTVTIIDRHSGEIIDTITLIMQTNVCGESGEPAAIAGSRYDLIGRILYLDFTTDICTPWFDKTIVAYDHELNELGRFLAGRSYQAVAFAGNLYGTTAPRTGPQQHWVWQGHGTEPWYRAEGETNAGLHGIVADWERGLIYEGVAGEVRVMDAGTRAVQRTVPVALLQQDGRLAGHDPISDNLYLLSGSGRLTLWATADMLASGAPPPATTELPQTAVLKVLPAGDWPNDLSMVALWQRPTCPAGSGDLYFSENAHWRRLTVASADTCVTDVVWTMAGTLFAAGSRPGVVYRSEDGGLSWQPATIPDDPAGARSLLLSSRFAQDGTIFLHTENGQLYRATDGGEQFSLLQSALEHVAISHEFGQDHTLVGTSGPDLLVSRDGGDSWAAAGKLPTPAPLALLSIAPQFAKWQTLFVYGENGAFYRSQDGGASWQPRMETAPVTDVQIVYGPTEAGREIFLHYDHGFDASYDGWNSTWSTDLAFHPSVRLMSTMTISPNFATDGLLIIGTVDGHIVTVAAGRPR